MAEDVVNRITSQPCQTKDIALIGAGGLTQAQGLPARLIRRYGAEAPRVAELARDEPALLQPVAPGIPALGVEFAFGVLNEGARSAADLIERRCRISLVDADVQRALPAAEAAIERWCD
jgi:glycerol-3-phosphate dehydrogenase